MKRLNQSGSHIIALTLLVLVLGVVGFTGYKVQQSHNKTDVASQTVTTIPKTIANTTDLQDVSQVLDQSSTQLSSSLDDGQLNADLNSML